MYTEQVQNIAAKQYMIYETKSGAKLKIVNTKLSPAKTAQSTKLNTIKYVGGLLK